MQRYPQLVYVSRFATLDKAMLYPQGILELLLRFFCLIANLRFCRGIQLPSATKCIGRFLNVAAVPK